MNTFKSSSVLMLALVLSVSTGRSDDGLFEESRQAEKAADVAERRNADLRNKTAALVRSAETRRTAAKLMTGELQTPPDPCDYGDEIAAFETTDFRLFRADGKTKGKSVVVRWLKLEPGENYRFTALVKAKGVDDASKVKFGLMVKLAGGKTSWPCANVGDRHRKSAIASMDETLVSFDYRLPSGAKAALTYGLSSGGTGEVGFKDIKVIKLND